MKMLKMFGDDIRYVNLEMIALITVDQDALEILYHYGDSDVTAEDFDTGEDLNDKDAFNTRLATLAELFFLPNRVVKPMTL